MKILWLSHFLPYPATGHGALQRSHNLLREAARRHEVHLVALATGATHAGEDARADALAALRSMVTSVRMAVPTSDSLGIQRALRTLGAMAGGRSYWERWLWSPALWQAVRSVAATGVDVLHVDSVFLAGYIAAAPRIPIVLNHHNIESDLLLKRSEMAQAWTWRAFFLREARKVARLEANWASGARTNLVVSALDGDRLRTLAGDVDTTVVANGVDVDFFSAVPGVAADPRHIAFAGGMDWFPNREAMEYLARELWPALRADDSGRRMTVIGRNPPEALLDAARSDDRLRVLGFVDDVRPHLSAAAVYLCPIRVGGGTRLKILDALSMSRALVSTALGVEGLDLVDGVHYLRAETPPEFVRQVRRLEEDDALRTRLGRAGRTFVEEHYSWRVIGASLDQAYLSSAGRASDSLPHTRADRAAS
jgi:glycosyltransferase involved in cell wall biosynthesis